MEKKNPTKQELSILGKVLASFLLLMFVAIITNEKEDHINTSDIPCVANYKECISQTELANHFQGIALAQAECQYQTEQTTKYGDPEFPFLYVFGSFNSDEKSYETGIITLFENNAKIPNVFGAKVRTRLACVYNLDQKKVITVYTIE